MHNDWREFIGLLNQNEVRYLVIGGWAVAFHGHPRFTGDIDFFVEASEDNARRVVKAIDEFGFSSLGICVGDFSPPGLVVQIAFPPTRIDLLTVVPGLSWDEAWEQRVDAVFQGLPLHFLDLDSLIASKRASGRPKDLSDLDSLESRHPL